MPIKKIASYSTESEYSITNNSQVQRVGVMHQGNRNRKMYAFIVLIVIGSCINIGVETYQSFEKSKQVMESEGKKCYINFVKQGCDISAPNEFCQKQYQCIMESDNYYDELFKILHKQAAENILLPSVLVVITLLYQLIQVVKHKTV